jgi:hypothetical protein
MFGTRTDLDRELKELRAHEKAQEVKVTLENKEGLELDTDRVRETVAYTLERSGAVSARTKRKRRYSSKSKSKKINVEEAKGSFFHRVSAVIERLFP